MADNTTSPLAPAALLERLEGMPTDFVADVWRTVAVLIALATGDAQLRAATLEAETPAK